MPYDDKSKRKNLSPEELLQQAKLLHPENEAFVRGETKNFYNRIEILANIYYQRGFPLLRQNLEKMGRSKIQDFGWTCMVAVLLLGLSLFVIIGYSTAVFENSNAAMICSGFILMPIALLMLFTGVTGAKSLFFIAGTTEKNIQSKFVDLVQDGKFLLGEKPSVDREKFYPDGRGFMSVQDGAVNRFQFRFISPATGKQRTMLWFTAQPVHITGGENIILLYLNDNCVIVL